MTSPYDAPKSARPDPDESIPRTKALGLLAVGLFLFSMLLFFIIGCTKSPAPVAAPAPTVVPAPVEIPTAPVKEQ